MKASEHFKTVIKEEMFRRAYADPNFGEIYTSTTKTLDDCVTYILNQVKNSGIIGFEDKEIYDMAEHFYSTPDLDPGTKIECDIVINKTVQLTEEEIAEERKRAIEKVHREVRDKALAKPKKTPVVTKPTETAKAETPAPQGQVNLFD